MSITASVNVAHKFEAQRQFTRVKLPARIHCVGANRKGVDARLLDLSAGGFAFIASGVLIQPGDPYKGRLLSQVDGISFSLEVGSQVRSADPVSRRVGCESQNLKPCEVAALRYLITSYLAGEAIGVGDILDILQRGNFIKTCKQGGGNGGMSFFGQVRAVTLSTTIFIVGAGTFTSVLNQTYNLYSVTCADSDVVGVPNWQVTMPHEGIVQGLLGPDTEIAKGASITTFSVNLLGMLKGNLTEKQFNPGNIERLLDHQMKGTLTNPCGCRMVQQLVVDGQYANKDQVIFTLASRGSMASTEARFLYCSAAELAPGTRVNFQIAGNGVSRNGRIVNIAPVDGNLSSEIHVQVRPDQPLDAQYTGHLAEVSVDDPPGCTLLNKAVILAAARQPVSDHEDAHPPSLTPGVLVPAVGLGHRPGRRLCRAARSAPGPGGPETRRPRHCPKQLPGPGRDGLC